MTEKAFTSKRSSTTLEPPRPQTDTPSLYAHLARTVDASGHRRTLETKRAETMDNDVEFGLTTSLLSSLAEVLDSEADAAQGRTERTSTKETVDRDQEAFWLIT